MITFNTINDPSIAIQDFGRQCQLVKSDVGSAFCYIPVSPIDKPLLPLLWQNIYNKNQFLPFWLHTEPSYLTILLKCYIGFWRINCSKGSYRQELSNSYSIWFSDLSQTFGIAIKESKNEQATVTSLEGNKIDTEKRYNQTTKWKTSQSKATSSDLWKWILIVTIRAAKDYRIPEFRSHFGTTLPYITSAAELYATSVSNSTKTFSEANIDRSPEGPSMVTRGTS